MLSATAAAIATRDADSRGSLHADTSPAPLRCLLNSTLGRDFAFIERHAIAAISVTVIGLIVKRQPDARLFIMQPISRRLIASQR